MTIIFTILGLGLFGGGLYAIYDGWPYLVLERGFTQVIIGTIAATAGLLMLSLAWVLREIKAMRREHAELVDLARGHAVIPAVVPLPQPFAEPPAIEPARPGFGPAVGPALGPALGLGAAAMAGGAVAAAVSRSGADDEPAGTQDRDLFGSLVAERLADEPVAEAETAGQPDDGHEAGKPTEDLFASAEKTEAHDLPVAVEDESHEPAEIVAAKVQPLSQDEALARTDSVEAEPVETGFSDGDLPAEPALDAPAIEPFFMEPGLSQIEDAGDEREPRADEVRPLSGMEDAPEESPEDSLPAPAEPEIDEFSALRDSLTSQLGGAGRVEPSLTKAPAPLSDDWRSAGDGRREPSFAPEQPPVEPAPPPADVAAPAWPPRTGMPIYEDKRSEPAAEPPLPPEHAAEPPREPAGERAEQEADAPVPVDEPANTEPAGSEPASSEEGVVGAYQVGDAHFTIFADGSIRARTPDGEYSFASMDELKVYLASEKSRLGV